MTSIWSRARALPRATLAASAILVACATLAFGFVLQRGGLLLPEASPSPSVPATGAPRSSPVTARVSPSLAAPGYGTAGAAASAAPGTTATTTLVATAAPTAPAAAPSVGSTRAPGPTASPSAPAIATQGPAPTATPGPTSQPTARPTPRPSPTVAPAGSSPGTASASRLAVLTKCASRPDCYVYTIRSGDNLWSVARWFGVPMDRVLALNPLIGPQAIVRPGEKLIIPTPTR